MNISTEKSAPVQAGRNEAAASGQKPLEDFIYLISHDLRNSVRALTELPLWVKEDLEKSGVQIPGPVNEHFAMMTQQMRRIDRMMIDLLIYSRVGRMQEVEQVALDGALDAVLSDVRVPAGFTLERRIDCPQIEIGSRDIMTLLTALVSNAVKHCDHDGCKITVGSRDLGDSIEISVTDEGPGIPVKFRETVFEPMQTLRPRDEVEGSGMGLASVRKIAEFYGGEVDLQFLQGERGTVIRVKMPKKGALHSLHSGAGSSIPLSA